MNRQDVRDYFVDEFGDGTLFASKSHTPRCIIGTPGCSRYFGVGLIYLYDAQPLLDELATFRAMVLTQGPYQTIPSVAKRVTFGAERFAFHAKDDHPLIREAVFEILSRHLDRMRILAVLRDKSAIVEELQRKRLRQPSYRYHRDELYDSLVRRLFGNLLHKDDQYHIHFSRRGKSPRTAAMLAALGEARDRFCRRWHISAAAPMTVLPQYPYEDISLQIVDYTSWAIQRYYEVGEERFLSLIWPAVRLILDLDGMNQTPHGVYYTQSHPILQPTEMAMPGV